MEALVLQELTSVQLYEHRQGTVEPLSEGKAQILELVQDSSRLVVLQCGEFVMPLDPASVPVLRIKPHYYAIPAEEDGVVIGLSLPEDIDQAEVDLLEAILAREAVFRARSDEPVIDDRAMLAKGIEKVGIGAGKAVLFAGRSIGKGVKEAGNALKKASKEGQQDRALPEPVKKAASTGKAVTSGTLVLSEAAVAKITGSASALGHAAALTIRRKVVGDKPAKPPGKFKKAAGEVGAATIASLFQVLDSVEAAGDQILDDTTEATADVVRHKFGVDAGGVTKDVMGSGIDVVKVVKTVEDVATPTGLAKTLGKKGAVGAAKGVAGIKQTE